VTDSVAYDSSVSQVELRGVMESLKRSQFRHVYAVCFDEKFVPVLSAAVEVEAIGPEFLYVFPSIDKAALRDIVKVQHGT
jgi:hypothetical protein